MPLGIHSFQVELMEGESEKWEYVWRGTIPSPSIPQLTWHSTRLPACKKKKPGVKLFGGTQKRISRSDWQRFLTLRNASYYIWKKYAKSRNKQPPIPEKSVQVDLSKRCRPVPLSVFLPERAWKEIKKFVSYCMNSCPSLLKKRAGRFAGESIISESIVWNPAIGCQNLPCHHRDIHLKPCIKEKKRREKSLKLLSLNIRENNPSRWVKFQTTAAGTHHESWNLESKIQTSLRDPSAICMKPDVNSRGTSDHSIPLTENPWAEGMDRSFRSSMGRPIRLAKAATALTGVMGLFERTGGTACLPVVSKKAWDQLTTLPLWMLTLALEFRT